MGHRDRRGIVLLIVLGILALMSVLAVSFVSLARLERSMSTNYVIRTRSLFAAESGIEYALARLREPTDWQTLSEAMRYNPAAPYLPLEQCEQPSFWADQDLDGDGVSESVSGVVGGSYRDNGDYFRLKVRDASGKLNLNDTNGLFNIDTDPFPDAAEFGEVAWVNNNTGAGVTDDYDLGQAEPRLYVIFQRLLFNLFGNDVLATNAANAVFDYREANGGRIASYSALREIALGAGLSEAQVDTLFNHVTLFGWQDPNVIRPTFTLSLTVDRRAGTDRLPSISYNTATVQAKTYFGFDWQTRGFEVEPRCPVNINDAGVELLEALISPLQAWWMRDNPTQPFQNHTKRYSYNEGDVVGSAAINVFGIARLTQPIANPRGLAEAIYDRIHGTTGGGTGMDLSSMPEPFTNWRQFEEFLYEPANLALLTTVPNQEAVYVDMMLANFNPNSRLNDFNPDRHRWRNVDKAQLTAYTTEFCFEPAGIFEIDCLGVIEDEHGEWLVRSGIKTVQELWKVYRETTQAQFMRGYGQTTTDLGEYFTANEEGLLPTAGTSFFKEGYTLQSYPEPHVEVNDDVPAYELAREGAGKFSYYNESVYDGSIALAAYRLTQPVGMTIPPRFLCSFDRSLRPDLFGQPAQMNDDILPANIRGVSPDHQILASDDLAAKYVGDFELVEELNPNFNKGVLNANQPTAARLTHPADDSRIPGVLHPDGGYSDAGRTLAYRAANFGRDMGQLGTIEFWIKPNYDPATTRHHTLLDLFTSKGSPQFNEPDFSLQFIPNGRSGSTTYWGSTPFGMNENPVQSSVIAKPCFVASTFKIKFDMGDFYALSAGNTQMSTYDLTQTDGDGSGTEYGFSPHEWSHIVYSWDHLGHAWAPEALGGSHMQHPNSLMTLILNGRQAMRDQYGLYSTYVILGGGTVPENVLPKVRDEVQIALWHDLEPVWNTPDNKYKWTTGCTAWAMANPNYLRFGNYCGEMFHGNQRARGLVLTPGDPSDDEVLSNTAYAPTDNFSFDATVANIISYDEGPYAMTDWLSQDVERTWDQGRYKMFYEEGRYLAQVDAEETAGCFTSHPVDLTREIAGLFQGDSLTLRSVSWSVDLPRFNRNVGQAGDYIEVRYPDVDEDGEEDPISVNVAVTDAVTGDDAWLHTLKKRMFQDADGSLDATGLAKYSRGKLFRYRVYFNLREDQVLYESPVFDDITFVFSLAKPNVLMWQSY